MQWTHRRSGDWHTATVKRRENGAWVPIRAPGDDSSDEYLLTGEPPSRSETVYESSYASLQDALDALEPDTRLVLDDGPYSGNWRWPSTNRITLDGDGTTLTRADTSSQLLRGDADGSEFADATSVAGTYAVGDEWIDVADASSFSVDDVVLLKDDEEDHRDRPYSSSGTGDEGTGFFHVVADVDTDADRIRIDEGCVHERTNPAGTLEAIRVDWAAEDQRITNVTLDGNDPGLDADTDVLRMFRRKDMWYDGVTGYDGTGIVWQEECYRTRVHDCSFDNTATTSPDKLKSVNFSSGDHHVLVTDCETTNYGHESITAGGGGGGFWGVRNVAVRNCHGSAGADSAFDLHPGGQNARYADCSVSESRFLRPRASDVTAERCEIVDPGTRPIHARNNPEDLTFRAIHCHGSLGTSDVFYFTTKAGRAADLNAATFRDFWVEDDDSDLARFWRLRNQDDETTISVNLVVDHVAVDETWITEANVDDWIYATGPIDLTTDVDSPSDGTTPSEYFDFD